MPDALLRLSVLKLDDTSFEVKIAMMGTVAELKMAVEDVFRDHIEEDGGKISWTHVWGHFCLCYHDYKLVDDRACLKDYGIKDGDQLRFIRLLQVNTCPITKHLQKHEGERNGMQLTGSGELENDNRNSMEDDISPGSTSTQEEHYHLFDGDNKKNSENSIVAQRESRISHMLRSWLSYSKLGSPRKSDRTLKPGKYFK